MSGKSSFTKFETIKPELNLSNLFKGPSGDTFFLESYGNTIFETFLVEKYLADKKTGLGTTELNLCVASTLELIGKEKVDYKEILEAVRKEGELCPTWTALAFCQQHSQLPFNETVFLVMELMLCYRNYPIIHRLAKTEHYDLGITCMDIDLFSTIRNPKWIFVCLE
jgi:hypothetical protein